jgi:hypothetical protein
MASLLLSETKDSVRSFALLLGLESSKYLLKFFKTYIIFSQHLRIAAADLCQFGILYWLDKKDIIYAGIAASDTLLKEVSHEEDKKTIELEIAELKQLLSEA